MNDGAAVTIGIREMMPRLSRGIRIEFITSFVTWILVHCTESLWFGDSPFDSIQYLIAGILILIVDIVIGFPTALLLTKFRGTRGWFYPIAGGAIGLIVVSLFFIALMGDWYEGYLDREGNPFSGFGLLAMYVGAILHGILDTGTGLEFISIGALGGFACWFGVRPP